MKKFGAIFGKLRDVPEYRTIVENFASLSILQIANYIFPIITLPYLVRVLGVENFGLLSFAQAIVNYFILITNYSFYFTGVQQVSLKREDKVEVSCIFSSVVIAKFFLMLLCFFLLNALVLTVERFRNHKLLYYCMFSTVVAEIFVPYWFFRGIEKMKFITIFTLLGRLLNTVFIFVFVKSVEHVIFVPIISALTTFLVAIAGIWVMFHILGYRFFLTSLGKVFFQLREGLNIFLSQVAINLYTASNTVILGFLADNVHVGYFTAGQRIVSIVLGFVGLVQQAVYPFANRLVSQDKSKANGFFRRLTLVMLVSGVLLSFLLLFFAPLLVKVILGMEYVDSIPVVRIMSFLPLVIGLSNVFGILVMLPYGLKREFMVILWVASFINVVLAFILVPLLKHKGTALSALITEIYVTLAMFLFLQQKGIKIFNLKCLSNL